MQKYYNLEKRTAANKAISYKNPPNLLKGPPFLLQRLKDFHFLHWNQSLYLESFFDKV